MNLNVNLNSQWYLIFVQCHKCHGLIHLKYQIMSKQFRAYVSHSEPSEAIQKEFVNKSHEYLPNIAACKWVPERCLSQRFTESFSMPEKFFQTLWIATNSLRNYQIYMKLICENLRFWNADLFASHTGQLEGLLMLSSGLKDWLFYNWPLLN
jgi:hypothetical protein